MNIKKFIKLIIIIPIAIAIMALLYVFLLLGESDDTNKNNAPILKISSPARNLNLSNAQFDEIMQEFGDPMLVKSSLPESLELSCTGSKGDYTYTLKAQYNTDNGATYSITAIKPGNRITNVNLNGYTLNPNDTVTVCGMRGLFYQSYKDIKIFMNSDKINYLICFPLINQEEILAELSSLSMSK